VSLAGAGGHFGRRPLAHGAPMHRILKSVSRLLRHEGGQDLMEYGLLAALIVVVAIAAVASVGSAVNGFWDTIAKSV
jgi:Flp pilus assembly pilin Flp